VAVVGEDFPQEHIRLLKRKGVDTKGLKVEEGKTFRWKGSYADDLNNPRTIATHLNLFENFRPELPSDYADEKVIFLANIDPDLQLDVLKQTNSPGLTAADTMNLWIATKKKALLQVLKRVDISVMNEAEAKQLTGETNLIMAGKKILSYGPKYVVVKKGEYGVLAISRKGIFLCPAYPVERVCDPTGAGDSFAGGLLGYLSTAKKIDERSLIRGVVYGSIIASFNVEGFDIKPLSRLNRTLIERRFKVFKKFCAF